MRVIGHLDADSYYCSAERVRFPWMRFKPVGVVGNQGACVIAASREMKAKGVRVGEAIWEAAKLCPRGVYVKRDFQWYEVLSKMMLEITKSFSDEVEYYAVDEFFFGWDVNDEAEAKQLASKLQSTILEQTQLPVTIGIARTKTLAKLLSDQSKPFGVATMLTRPDEEAFLAQRPITDVCGIANRRAKRLAPYSVHSILDLCKMRVHTVRKVLTIVGEKLWYELHGEKVSPIQTQRPLRKEISRGGSLGRKTRDPLLLNAFLARNVEKLIEELDFYHLRVGKIVVWISQTDEPTGIGECILDSVSGYFEILLRSAQEALANAWDGGEVTRMQVIFERLHGEGPVQRTLFEDLPDPALESAQKAKREINQKLGRFTLRSGSTLPLWELYNDLSWGYEICDIREKMCF